MNEKYDATNSYIDYVTQSQMKLEVKKLGEAIGYGNMMHLASECWQERLIEKYGSPVGAFTVGKPIGALPEPQGEEA